MIAGLLRALSPRRARLLERANLQRAGILTMGRSTYGDFAVKTFGGDKTTLEIGNYCSIAGGVTFILGGNHPSDRISTFPFREMFDLPGKWTDGFPSSRGPILVGSDVWIGTGATILSGVTIGHGAVIAAGSIVTRDVAPYTIAAGAPARQIRSRLPDHLVQALLEIRWWDWSPEKVKRASHLLNDRIEPEEAIDGLRIISS